MLPITTNHDGGRIIQAMDTAALKADLAKTVTVTAEYLMYIAAIWQELELRGEDMSSLRHGMMTYIPLIATRQLDARLVVDYAGQKTLLAALAKLPPSQQIELAESRVVEVVEWNDGEPVTRIVPLSDLSARQVYQVLGDGRVKSPQQQHRVLVARAETKKSTTKSKKGYRMTSNIIIDGTTLVVAGRYGISIAQIQSVIANALGDES